MDLLLRILLFITSLGSLIFVLIRIRKSQMQIDNAVFWIIFMIGLVIISIFPGIVTYFSRLIGIDSPVNFVFLCIIFILLIKVFYMSMKISKLQYQIRQLTQIIVLDETRSKFESNKSEEANKKEK